MKRTVMARILVMAALFIGQAFPSFALDYVLVKLTDNPENDNFPRINTVGQTTWQVTDATGSAVMFHDGKSARRISDASYYNSHPRISDMGTVVWKGRETLIDHLGEYAIFLFDGKHTTKIHSVQDAGIHDLQMNAGGLILWEEEESDFTRLMLYDASGPREIDRISSYLQMYYAVQLGPSGQVVWEVLDEETSTLFTFTGTSPAMLASFNIDELLDHNLLNLAPVTTPTGGVAWRGWDGETSQLFMNSGGNSTPVPPPPDLEGLTVCFCPHASSGALLAWEATDGASYFLLESDGITTRLVDTNAGPLSNTDINENGQAVWQAWCQNGTSFDLKFYDGVTVHQIGTPNQSQAAYPMVNAKGMIVWQEWDGNDFEIVLARPITPADMLEQLIVMVQNLGLADGISTSLIAKLHSAQATYAGQQSAATADTLQSFINQVTALTAKKIQVAGATLLIGAAERIIAAL